MKQLIVGMLLLSSTVHAQKQQIGRDTYLSTKDQTMKVYTTNDTVVSFIINKYEDSLSTHTIVYKKDRAGRYKDHTFKLPIVLMPVIVRYCQSLNRKQ